MLPPVGGFAGDPLRIRVPTKERNSQWLSPILCRTDHHFGWRGVAELVAHGVPYGLVPVVQCFHFLDCGAGCAPDLATQRIDGCEVRGVVGRREHCVADISLQIASGAVTRRKCGRGPECTQSGFRDGFVTRRNDRDAGNTAGRIEGWIRGAPRPDFRCKRPSEGQDAGARYYDNARLPKAREAIEFLDRWNNHARFDRCGPDCMPDPNFGEATPVVTERGPRTLDLLISCTHGSPTVASQLLIICFRRDFF